MQFSDTVLDTNSLVECLGSNYKYQMTWYPDGQNPKLEAIRKQHKVVMSFICIIVKKKIMLMLTSKIHIFPFGLFCIF